MSDYEYCDIWEDPSEAGEASLLTKVRALEAERDALLAGLNSISYEIDAIFREVGCESHLRHGLKPITVYGTRGQLLADGWLTSALLKMRAAIDAARGKG